MFCVTRQIPMTWQRALSVWAEQVWRYLCGGEQLPSWELSPQFPPKIFCVCVHAGLLILDNISHRSEFADISLVWLDSCNSSSQRRTLALLVKDSQWEYQHGFLFILQHPLLMDILMFNSDLCYQHHLSQDWVTVWDTMVEAIHLIVNCCRLTLFEGNICSSALKTTFHFTLYPLIAHMMAPINLYVQSFALNIELGFSSGWSCRLDWDALGGKGGWVAGCPHHHCANHWKGRMGARRSTSRPQFASTSTL